MVATIASGLVIEVVWLFLSLEEVNLMKYLIILLVLVSIATVSCKKGPTTSPQVPPVPPDTIEYLVGIEIEGSGVGPRCWHGWYYRLWSNFEFVPVDGCTTSVHYFPIVDPPEGLYAKIYSLSSNMELRISFIDSTSDSVLSEIKATVDSSDFIELMWN